MYVLDANKEEQGKGRLLLISFCLLYVELTGAQMPDLV